TEDNTIIDSLQNLVQILQKQLDGERNENHFLGDEDRLLQTPLREECATNSKHIDSPKETEEKEIVHINQVYPQKELTLMKDYGKNCCPKYNYINDKDYDPHITTKEIPYTATELTNEVAEELLNYSRKYGPINVSEEKFEKTKGVRHIASPNDKPEKGKQVSNHQYWWSLGVKKQIPKDVIHGSALDKLIKIVLNWHCPKSIVPNSPTKCGIVPIRKQCCVLNALGTTEAMDIALIKILLPGEENLLLIKMVIGDIPNYLLGMDVLAGR
ncbi:hypothetical protein Nmel_000521, partial [Mimus melanotis]